MEAKDFIEVVLQRTQQSVAEAVKELTQRELAWRAGPEANSMGFLLWHITRSEDRNFQSTLQQKPQIWETGKWPEKLGMATGPAEFGFGYTPEQVANFPVPPPSLMLEYAQAVRNGTLEYVHALTPQKLNERIQHPAFGNLSAGQLIGRVLGHVTEHIGQIAYIRGLLKVANK